MALFKGSYLIAGATGAIGRSLAAVIRQRGGTPVLCGRDAAKLEALQRELAALPSPRSDAALPPSVVVDFADPEQVNEPPPPAKRARARGTEGQAEVAGKRKAGSGLQGCVSGLPRSRNNRQVASTAYLFIVRPLPNNAAASPQVAAHLSPDQLPSDLCGFAYAVGSVTLKPLRSADPQAFLDAFRLNTVSAVEATKAVLPLLKGQKVAENASIVLFSTVAVQSGFPNHAVVSAAKGGVEGLTRALAAELAAAKVRVNCVAPSLTDESTITKPLTSNQKMAAAIAAAHPLPRLGRPFDSAAAAAYLLSEDAAWVTGQVLGVDGGRSSLVLK